MSSIIFMSEGNYFSSSVKHRCLMISENLNKYNYVSKVFTSGTKFKINNVFNQIVNYRKVISEKPDFVIVHRSSNLIDYYFLRKLKNLGIKIIFDFDDALFHVRVPGRLISYSHLNEILKLCDAVSVGSHYLADYAKQFNKNVFLIPTPVDTSLFMPRDKEPNKDCFIIGWLGNGNDYQFRYLKMLKEPLKQISKKYSIELRIISAFSKNIVKEFQNEKYDVDFGYDHWIPLEKLPEIITDFDVGVMPLSDEPFSRGKCAMKALEYMAMGIPTVVSPVGENSYLIKNGYNGFLAETNIEWVNSIEELINNKNLGLNIGLNGIKTVNKHYSLKVVTNQLINLFEELN